MGALRGQICTNRARSEINVSISSSMYISVLLYFVVVTAHTPSCAWDSLTKLVGRFCFSCDNTFLAQTGLILSLI